MAGRQQQQQQHEEGVGVVGGGGRAKIVTATTTTADALIPGLPDEIALLCLAGLPLEAHGRASGVSRAWRRALQSEHMWRLRRTWARTQHLLCLFRDDPALTHADMLDPTTGKWTRLPLMPSAVHCSHVDCFAAVGLSASVYVLGHSVPCSTVFRFDRRRRRPCRCRCRWERHHHHGGPGRGRGRGRGPGFWMTKGCNGPPHHFVVLNPPIPNPCPDGAVLSSVSASGDGEGVGWHFLPPYTWHHDGDNANNNFDCNLSLGVGDVAVIHGRGGGETSAASASRVYALHLGSIYRYDIAYNSWVIESSLPRQIDPEEERYSLVALNDELYVVPSPYTDDHDTEVSSPYTDDDHNIEVSSPLVFQVYNPRKRSWRLISTKPLKESLYMSWAAMCSVEL